MTGLENRKKGKFFLEFSAILEVAERQEVHTPFLFFHQGLGVFFFFSFIVCLAFWWHWGLNSGSHY
jgi:hypothetical protein